jgi:hypothetical protein
MCAGMLHLKPKPKPKPDPNPKLMSLHAFMSLGAFSKPYTLYPKT